MSIVDRLPALLKDDQKLGSFCEILVEATKLAYPIQSNPADLVLVTTPSGGMIYPLSDRTKQDAPLIRNTETLRAQLLSDDPWHGLSVLPSRWGSLVAELLQIELNIHAHIPPYWRKCLTCLQKVVRQFTQLPPSFFMPDRKSVV